MFSLRHGKHAVFPLCQTLCLCAIWVQATTAFPQAAAESNGSIASLPETFALAPKFTGLIPSAPIPSAPVFTGLIPSAPAPPGLIPSAPAPPGLIPSAPVPSGLIPSAPLSTLKSSQPAPSGLIPSQPPPSGLIPSQPPPSGLIPSQPPPSGLIPSQPPPSGLIPSQPMPSTESPTQIVPSASVPTLIIPSASKDTVILTSSLATNGSNGPTTLGPMASTEEPLRPIPAPTTAPGDPDGHHEITEPNFTATLPCRGCSPVIEISRTGFVDWPTTPIAEHDNAGPTSPTAPPKATITAGSSHLVISKESTGANFVVGNPTGGSTTVTPGQTITFDNTPIVIQTTASGADPEVIIGTSETRTTVALKPPSHDDPQPQITEAPVLQPITIGTQTISAEGPNYYVIGSQTLSPGSPAITVDGTTISLAPSATALIVNGETTTLVQAFGAIYTSTAMPLITLFNTVYTANRAGYYILGPGTTLIAGGPPITVSNTVVSLEPHGTEVVVQGATSTLAPITTIVTLTRGGGGVGGAGWSSYPGGNFAQSTGSILPSIGAANGRGVMVGGMLMEGWVGMVMLVGAVAFGWLGVWL